jgi:hypothetical protein
MDTFTRLESLMGGGRGSGGAGTGGSDVPSRAQPTQTLGRFQGSTCNASSCSGDTLSTNSFGSTSVKLLPSVDLPRTIPTRREHTRRVRQSLAWCGAWRVQRSEQATLNDRFLLLG